MLNKKNIISGLARLLLMPPNLPFKANLYTLISMGKNTFETSNKGSSKGSPLISGDADRQWGGKEISFTLSPIGTFPERERYFNHNTPKHYNFSNIKRCVLKLPFKGRSLIQQTLNIHYTLLPMKLSNFNLALNSSLLAKEGWGGLKN